MSDFWFTVWSWFVVALALVIHVWIFWFSIFRVRPWIDERVDRMFVRMGWKVENDG